MQRLNLVDNLLCELDKGLRTVFAPPKRQSLRETPGKSLPDCSLSTIEKHHIAGLMRVNHAGEVCAQALYHGQALTAQLAHIKSQMTEAADEETEHLAWCEQRLSELGSGPSKLNLIWYGWSYLIGALAGLAGDRWSLGFVAETEHQVTAHLTSHLQQLPAQDEKTQAILRQMQADEIKHAKQAEQAGGHDLPGGIKQLMKLVSKLMTKTSYHI